MSVRRAALALLAAAAVAGAAAAHAADVAATEETPEILPDGEGRDAVFYACVPCHSTQLVRRQAMSRERWSETLDWMTARHGMPELEAPDRAVVLDYLARHFGPGAAGEAPRPFFTPPVRKNPFAPQ